MAGNRCDNCSKFVSLETDEPQENSIEVSDSGTVTIDVDLARNCGECGSEMKSANFDVEEQIDEAWVAEHSADDASDNGHGDWEVESSSLESTESGGGRYAKNMIGFTCTATVTCKCGSSTTVEISDAIGASEFDEV